METIKEVRLVTKTVQFREDGETPVLEGYASVFDQAVDIWGLFDETIDKRAFDQPLAEKQDTRALANHDSSLLLGRVSNGTLQLRTDETGLFDSIFPNLNTSAGRDWTEYAKRGDVKGQSFQFTVAEDKWTFEKGKRDSRRILRVGDLLDVGPVTFPAYEGTTIALRSTVTEQYRAARSLFEECSTAFGADVSELRCFNGESFSMDATRTDGERGRYVYRDAEGRDIFVFNRADYDEKPLVRGLKSTPVSVLRKKLDLREREQS